MNEKKTTILVVDDEPHIRKMLNIFLYASHFKVEEADSGQQALRIIGSVKPDIILLDLGLTDMDGKDVIEKIRKSSQVPIIIMSVRALDEEVVMALEAGADDYVIKPFNNNVLMARIKVNLRKALIKQIGETDLTNGPLRMDLMRHEVYLNDKKLSFTPREYELLRYFMTNRGRMLSHKQILSEVWGAAHKENQQYLRVYVGQVREKLVIGSEGSQMIINEPGVGYRMESLEDNLPNSA